MASYLVQAGTSLYRVSTAGVATLVTLPTGITLYGSTQPCRPLLFGSGGLPSIIVVNGGTHDFFIDYSGTARKLQISAPVAAPGTVIGVGTGLTGSYGVACTFKVKDPYTGATILESALGPLSALQALTNKTLGLVNIPVSGDLAVNARGLYRTLTGGNTPYPWFDIDNNTTLSEDRGVADSVLSLLPAAAIRFGTPPDLKLVATWRDRLWGVPRQKQDYVRWTEDRNFYGWSQDNELVVPPQNADAFGVTAFIPRRDTLGCTRRRRTYMVVGFSNDSFQRVGISESLGCVSQESVVIKDNIAYMLGEESVNQWSDSGVISVSDMQVDAWFRTDDYFNRAMFPSAQGRYNPETNCYELLLAAVGSTILNRWVSFNLKTRIWLGPHKTDANFTPTCCGTTSAMRGTLSDSNVQQITVFGATNGYVYRRDKTTPNDDGIAVTLSVDLPPLSANEPDLLKYFDGPTLHTRPESQGTLTVTPIVGELSTVERPIAPDAPLYHDLTTDREVLDRLGAGRYCQLNLSHSATTERPRIYGIEIPYAVIGRR